MTFTVNGWEHLGEFNNLDIAIIIAEANNAVWIDQTNDDGSLPYWERFAINSQFWRKHRHDGLITADVAVAFDKTF